MSGITLVERERRRRSFVEVRVSRFEVVLAPFDSTCPTCHRQRDLVIWEEALADWLCLPCHDRRWMQ
jgi:hypothetical protein